MVMVRGTKKFRERVKVPEREGESSGALGDWYAKQPPQRVLRDAVRLVERTARNLRQPERQLDEGAPGDRRSAREVRPCSCRGCSDLSCSQRLVDHGVDVTAERVRVHRRQLRPPLDEHARRHGLTPKWNQERDRLAVSRHGHSLTSRDSVDHATPVVAQVTNRDFGHETPYYA